MKNTVKIIATVLTLAVSSAGFVGSAEAMMMKGHHGKCMMHSKHGKCMMMHHNMKMKMHHMKPMMKKY